MKLTLRNLQRQTFTVDIEEDKSVKVLKEKIEELKGSEYPASGLKLIYDDKILLDDSQLSEYSIEEDKHVLLMITRPKTASSVDADTLDAERVTEPEGSPTSEAEGASSLPLEFGSSFEDNVQTIMAMGYDRRCVEKALTAAFNNAERAVEYLLGTPSDSAQEDDSDDGPVGAGGSGSGGTGGVRQGELGYPFEYLRSTPMFDEMRQAVRENPQLLNSVIEQLAERDPALQKVIFNHKEEFLRMMTEDSASSTPSGSPLSSSSSESASNPFRVELSAQDKEVIERLKSLGFQEDFVIQVYFACGKNEGQAANLLLSNPEDD